MLLESLAERLAKEVLSTYPTIQGITIHIKKPQVHLEGVMDTVGKRLPYPLCVFLHGFQKQASMAWILPLPSH